MRNTIETAPRNGNVVILKDEARGTYDVAHWSPESGEWIGEDGETTKIMPSHWYPLPADKDLEQGLSSPSQAATPARRYNFFPFSLRRDASQAPVASEVVAPTRPSHGRRGFATSWIAAILVTAALVGMY